MDNKNTNSAGYNKDENYTGRTVSRKKENSSHETGHDRRQDHSRSGGYTSENYKQDHSHSKNHGQNYSNMERGKMRVGDITKITEIMEIERPKTRGGSYAAKANRILLPIQGIRWQMHTDVNQNHPNPV